MKMGIDPVTHKPVSQVLSDLGSISGLSSNGNQMSFVEHTQEEQIQQHVFGEVASSSSSSSSPNLTRLSSPQSYTCQTSQTQITPYEALTQTRTPTTTQITLPSSSFDWSEFLQNDPFISSLMQSEEEISNNGNSNEGFGAVACDASKDYEGKKQCEGNSFVDAILDRDSEIRAAFPELLEGSFDY